MATTKNAMLRYHVLDKCLRNTGRRYSIRNLLDKVNEALAEEDPTSSGVQMRQLRDDISFMKTVFGAPIHCYREGKSYYYCYEEGSYSINQSPLSATEAEQLKNTIGVLHRFEGSPGFEWVREMGPMLTSQFGLKAAMGPVMAFESNIDYSGYEFISPIFNAIVNQRVLEISYQPFQSEGFRVFFHPYYLKQYNSRWFVFGYNEENGIDTWNFALDRIQGIREVNHVYQTCALEWEEHFYDLIGVTRQPGAEAEDVNLLFSEQQAPYVKTKPIHASQKAILLDDGKLEVRLKVVINYELETLLLSFGDKVKVLWPQLLQERIRDRLAKAISQYNF